MRYSIKYSIFTAATKRVSVTVKLPKFPEFRSIIERVSSVTAVHPDARVYRGTSRIY